MLLLTIRSRSLTNFRLAAGLPGGSVQTRVTRSGDNRGFNLNVASVFLNVSVHEWRCPVASALLGDWSNIRIGQVASVPGPVLSARGKLLVSSGRPQPSSVVEVWVCRL